MKKILVMVAVAMMTAVSVNAQSGYEDTKHEVGISYGAMSNTTWMSIGDAMGTILTFGAVKYDDGKFTGPIAVEYFYHVNPVIGVGAIGAYAHETKDILIANDKYSKSNVENQSESKVGFNFQVSALGIEAGSENIRAFAEFGVGEQGVILGGIRAKF